MTFIKQLHRQGTAVWFVYDMPGCWLEFILHPKCPATGEILQGSPPVLSIVKQIASKRGGIVAVRNQALLHEGVGGSGCIDPRILDFCSVLSFALTVKNAVFWDVTPCGSCKNRRFGGP
jgi:hypothetical protein